VRANARDLLKNIEQRVEKQSLDVSISSINEKNSKTINKLRETSKFLDNLYGNVEMLNKNFEEIKNVKEYIQEIEENVVGMKVKFSKDIEVG
jgi:transcriptional regulator